MLKINIEKRLKVLIIAHELSPINGSECAVGWNIVTRLARFHDVTVLYANGSQHGKNNSYKNAIENYLQSNSQINGLTFVNIEQPRKTKIVADANRFFARKLGPTGIPMLYYYGYECWQKAAFAKAKELHETNRFDVAHQLTQISFREPGFLWKLGIPFFWGPTGGTSVLPKLFYKTLPLQFRIFEKIRNYSNTYHFNFTSRIKSANKKASIIYSFSNRDAFILGKRAIGEVKIMTESGTYPSSESTVSSRKNSSGSKGLWIGRLTDYKAPGILLKALSLSEITKENLKIIIIGEGPLEASLVKLAEELNLNNIEWIKKVNHQDVFKLMKESDFLIHTSLREGTPNVIMEALSMGLPVICHDAYGMSIAINDTCGIKVPFISPEKSIKAFHDAISRVVTDKNLLENLKTGALKRASEISWDRIAETIANDYSSVTSKIHKELQE